MTPAAQWLADHALPCLYHRLLGIACPFCGIQRALMALLNGDARGSLLQCPILMPLALCAATMAVAHRRSRTRLRNGMAIAACAMLAANAIYQNIVWP